MRLNKKRLAALAMSAVMAASAVPFPVYAEELSAGDDVVVSSEVVAEPTTEAVVETPEVGRAGLLTSVTMNYDWETGKISNVKITDVDGKVYTPEELGATVSDPVVTPKTCHSYEKVVVKITVDGAITPLVWSQENTAAGKLEHTWEYFQEKTQTGVCNGVGDAAYDIYTQYKKCTAEGCDQTKVATSESVDKDNYQAPVKVKAEHKEGEIKSYKVSESSITADGVTAVNTKLDKDGKPVLINTNLSGKYGVQYECPVCKETFWKQEELEATTYGPVDVLTSVEAAGKEAYKPVNISDVTIVALENKNFTPGEFPLSQEKMAELIELEDCEKAGQFTIKYTIDGKDRYATYTVDAHHYQTYDTVVVKDSEKNLIKVSVDSETRKATVTSNSCKDTVEYIVVTHCSADDCGKAHTIPQGYVELTDKNVTAPSDDSVISERKETVKPAGDHSYVTIPALDKIVKDGKAVTIAELVKAVNNNKNVKLTIPENICETGGTVKVDWVCQVCGASEKTADVKILQSNHVEGDIKVENEVKATCTSEGSKDEVTRCVYCNKVLSKTTFKTGRLKHTNETAVAQNSNSDKTATVEFVGTKFVDDNSRVYEYVTTGAGKDTGLLGAEKDAKKVGNNKDNSFNILMNVYTECEECGGNKHILTGEALDSLKVVDIKKQDDKGQGGYIVLEAKFTRSDENNVDKKVVTVTSGKIPYYSSMDAYTGRTEPEVLNGIIVEDGVAKYYVNGVFQKDYTGMVTDGARKFLVVEGLVAKDMNGLWYDEASKTWFFFVEGEVSVNHTGLTLYDGEWFYVANGKLDEAVTGLVPYNGGTFLFTEGRLRNDVNGLWQDINNLDDWYFLALGQVQNLYSGVAQYDGAFFVVKNGKLDTSYNGTIKYDGETFKVVNGQLITK